MGTIHKTILCCFCDSTAVGERLFAIRRCGPLREASLYHPVVVQRPRNAGSRCRGRVAQYPEEGRKVQGKRLKIAGTWELAAAVIAEPKSLHVASQQHPANMARNVKVDACKHLNSESYPQPFCQHDLDAQRYSAVPI